MQNALKNGVISSLTGPVERADTGTISKHLACLDGQKKQMYCLLSELLIPAAQEKHPGRDYQSINTLLQDAFSDTVKQYLQDPAQEPRVNRTERMD